MRQVTLYLMNKKGLAVLESLVRSFGANSIKEVITSRNKGVVEDFYQDIVDCCNANKIKCIDRKKYEGHTGYAIAVGWRWMLEPKDLIVMHDSLLPEYRGFSPLVNMLINGEDYIGVTALFAGDGSYDTGEVINHSAKHISYPIKISDAIDIIAEAYAEIATKIVDEMLSGLKIGSVPQPEHKATYSVWRDEEDYYIDWTQDAKQIRRHVDAVGHPYKGAITKMRSKGDVALVRVSDVAEEDDVVIAGPRPIGKVIFMNGGKPTVVCGTGLITINSMKYEGTDFEAKPRTFRTRFGV